MTGISTSSSIHTLESNVKILESEAIYVLREAAAQFNKLGLLFSGGKDSLTLLQLAKKAFFPAGIPASLIHVDTNLNFPEVLDTINDAAINNRMTIIRGSIDEEVKAGNIHVSSRDLSDRFNKQGDLLTSLIQTNNFDGVLGGGRRDEDSARAKERFFSHRDEFGQWNTRNQRPEVWQIFNGRVAHGEHMRVFPISNWTELDVLYYVGRENIKLPAIYYAHQRDVVARSGTFLDLETGVVKLQAGEVARRLKVRARTVGDIPTSGFIVSEADTIEKIMLEVAASRKSERSSRPTDAGQGRNLEELKIKGHF